MAESVEISRNERFLEVGCGTGAISILVGRRAMGGIGVDISSTAVANANHNATVLNVTNVLFYPSNVFDQVREHFDIVVCNPPYSCYPARDVVERMFWDPRDEMKRKLFAGAQARLRNTGRIYFGWANFKDVDEELPLRLAKKHGFTLRSARQRSSNSGKYSFLVLEFQKSTNRTYWS
jgi:methylase of polypeptide subunit release factors